MAKTGVGVGIFSLEMSAGQLVTRLLCIESRVDAGRVRTGNYRWKLICLGCFKPRSLFCSSHIY